MISRIKGEFELIFEPLSKNDRIQKFVENQDHGAIQRMLKGDFGINNFDYSFKFLDGLNRLVVRFERTLGFSVVLFDEINDFTIKTIENWTKDNDVKINCNIKQTDGIDLIETNVVIQQGMVKQK